MTPGVRSFQQLLELWPEVRPTVITRTALLSLVVTLLAGAGVAACGSGSSPRPTPATPSTATAAHASTASVATTTATRPGPATVAAGDPAAYGEALREVQAYLDAWKTNGQLAAAKLYIDPDQWPADGPELKLLDGTVVSHRPASWSSADDFKLLITMNMHFPGGDGGAFGDGPNTRFITFTRSPSGHPFLMSWATSP